MKTLFHTLRAVLAAAPLFLLSGCESSTGSNVEVYALASVKGVPLPAPFASGLLVLPHLVTEGALELRGDGKGSTSTTLSCPPTVPAGTECIDQPPLETTLTYSREGEWVRFADGTQYTATFADGAVTIYYPNAPYEYRQ